MADLVNASAQAIADALAPTPQAPAARWRWGSVVSVNADGTMNVSIGGATVPSIRCAQHVMGANVGDRVRVLYCGTECMVDAIRAADSEPHIDAQEWLTALGAPFLRFAEVTTATQSISSGSVGYFSVAAPTYTGYTLRGAIQTWASGSGTVIIGGSYRSSSDNNMHFVVRANNAASVVVKALLLYTLDAITS